MTAGGGVELIFSKDAATRRLPFHRGSTRGTQRIWERKHMRENGTGETQGRSGRGGMGVGFHPNTLSECMKFSNNK